MQGLHDEDTPATESQVFHYPFPNVILYYLYSMLFQQHQGTCSALRLTGAMAPIQ